jgi:hypothetical protein
MAAQTINSPLSESQLYMLRLMANIKDDDLIEIKKLVRKYLAQKLTKQADAVWEQNEWTATDEEQILNTHLRTPYKNQ